MAGSKEKRKSFLMKVKEESEKAVLKLNIQKAKIMASSHHFLANRWEKVQTVTNFIFLGSKITAMVFPSVMCGCASWTIKKAECWRIDTFELWCWRRLLRVPWGEPPPRRSNQSILKEISPGCSLEGLMLKLKLQYFGHLMRRVDSLPWCWEGLGAGGEGDDRGWDGWMASLTRWTWVWVNSGRWWWTGKPGMLRFIGSQTVGHD